MWRTGRDERIKGMEGVGRVGEDGVGGMMVQVTPIFSSNLF